MAKLRQALTADEVKKTGVSDVRKAYVELAKDYNRIIDGDICYCHRCNEFKVRTAFYQDKRFISGLYCECKECLLDQATDYDKKTKSRIDNKEKTIEVLRKLDLPYIDSLYQSALSTIKADVGERTRENAYQHMLVMLKSLPQYKNKTFADSEFSEADLVEDEEQVKIVQKTIKAGKKRFGMGFSNEDYMYLENNYQDWCSRTQVDSLSQETYVKQICLQLLDIDKDRKAGKDVSKKLDSLDKLMNAANLQPKQNITNSATDALTFGQLIEKWEMEDPIPEPDEEFKDVNHIGKLIRVFFSGWLCKALGIKNAYSQECEDFMAQYEVVKQEVKEEGSSSDIYDRLFGSDGE